MTKVSVKTALTVLTMPEHMYTHDQNIWLPLGTCKEVFTNAPIMPPWPTA